MASEQQMHGATQEIKSIDKLEKETQTLLVNKANAKVVRQLATVAGAVMNSKEQQIVLNKTQKWFIHFTKKPPMRLCTRPPSFSKISGMALALACFNLHGECYDRGQIDSLETEKAQSLNKSIEIHTVDDEGNSNNDEAVEWVVDEEEDDEARIELGLVGKIWTDRHINSNAFMNTTKNTDKHRVLDGQPWHFDRHAIILDEMEGSEKPLDVKSEELPMWVRVYNLPFKGRLNIANVESIGNKIGTFVKMDNNGMSGIEKSIRLRVRVNVTKLLVREDARRMGHGVKDCDDGRDEDDPKLPYGGWLKASPWKHARDESNEMSVNPQSTCAKSLFITKPRTIPVALSKKKIGEVVDKLTECAISNEQNKDLGIIADFSSKTSQQEDNEGNDITLNVSGNQAQFMTMMHDNSVVGEEGKGWSGMRAR
uniref:DUF4283 domain-containing protein n=1 Tax=Chenopodium quinoa TaxID=63459 RepID=A0A803MZ26_CHEQI